jgi:5-methylcytosine-specific restriction protein B
MSYFTQHHFDLLNTYEGQKNDKANPEHVAAYEELASAYKIVEEWAQQLKQERFTDGKINIIKKPTNQANKFDGYLWGKLYPSENSAKELAYTVDISTNGAIVKIDSVGLGDRDEKRIVLRALRDEDANTKIISTLSIDDCLNMDMEQLVAWSNKQLDQFNLSYDEVANKIGLNKLEVAADNNVDSHSEQTANLKQPYDKTPLNQILYGPPGTGKTYHTIEKAVMAAEPTFLPTAKSKDELRSAFKAKYDELIAINRIRFVTFHQSYGYEEFVEGLSAKTEGDQLSYFEKDGVFKEICKDAKDYFGDAKFSKKSIFEDKWDQFSNELTESDSGIKINTPSHRSSFTVTDATDTTIRFDKQKGQSIHSLSLKTLQAVYNEEKEISGGLNPYYIALAEHLEQLDSRIGVYNDRKNFVLIIDEINRGNISKIYGELITLIEPSKRMGQSEELEVSLPYTGERFSVPDNLYIIGTMNTADRSLALMDTALRRRFDFVEMMPDYSVLKDDENQPYCIQHSDNQIDLVALLSTLNKRISALYDREHTLGHAFLIPVIDEIKANNHSGALTELANCFKNRLIPLLAEYFFENWQKIRLVLGDNQKQKSVQLIQETEVDFESLFGDTEDLDIMDDETKDYQLIKTDSALWQNPLTYIGIYNPSDVGE